nr:hypothetical protein [Candidatus Woesearchaeota archaeon]
MKGKLFFITLFMLLTAFSFVSASHMTNDYGRYDDQNPRYHYSYYNYDFRNYRYDYRYNDYESRYRSYYYRYHPLTGTRAYSMGYDRSRGNINIRIVNSPDSIVRVN